MMKYIILIWIVAICIQTGRSEIFVGTEGNFSSLVEAYEAALDGEIIRIAEEVFTGENNTNISLGPKNITFQGESSESSIIDCGGNSRAFYMINPSEDLYNFEVNFHSLTIRNCLVNTSGLQLNTRSGGAIHISYTRVTVNIFDCIFENNLAKASGFQDTLPIIPVGGAVFVQGKSPGSNDIIEEEPINLNIENTIFRNNIARETSGTNRGRGGALAAFYTNVVGQNLTFISNEGFEGGAFYVGTFSKVNVTNSLFQNNKADTRGGAFFSTVQLNYFADCQFLENRAQGAGGSIRIQSAASLTARRVIWSHNVAQGASGGAVSTENGGVDIEDCIFTFNNATSGGALSQATSFANLKRNQFSGNNAFGGGALSFFGRGGLVQNCDIFNNTAASGGGISLVSGAEVEIRSSSIVNNLATSEGGGVWCSDSTITFVNTTIENNNSPNDADFHCSTTVSFTKCKVFGDSPFTDLCKDQEVDEKLNSVEILLIAVGSIIGFAFLLSLICFCIYFSNSEHRYQQGWFIVKEEVDMTDD